MDCLDGRQRLENLSCRRQVAVSKPHEGSRMSVHEIDCHQRRPFGEKAMVRYRSHSIEFKRQACSRVPVGEETLKGLALGCKVRGRRARRGGLRGRTAL